MTGVLHPVRDGLQVDVSTRCPVHPSCADGLGLAQEGLGVLVHDDFGRNGTTLGRLTDIERKERLIPGEDGVMKRGYGQMNREGFDEQCGTEWQHLAGIKALLIQYAQDHL
jgi:hypothetical protein